MTSTSDIRPDNRFPIGAAVTAEQLATDPLPALAELRAAEPVSWLPAVNAWLVTRRDLAVEAMRNADDFTVDDPRFTTAVVLGPSMLSLDGPEHERHRRPFAPAFRPGILREHFDAFLTDQVGDLLDGLDLATDDLRTRLAGPLAVNTIARFLGLEGVTAEEVLEWYQSIARAITELTLGGEMRDGDAAIVRAVHDRVQAAIDESTSVSLLRSVEATGLIRPDEMATAAVVLMFGAIETAEGMTANACWHLLSIPGLWKTVQADRTLVAGVVEESVRVEPAAAVIDRYATRDVELGGALIQKGDLVTISLLGANHDPDEFSEPERFDPRRENLRRHVSFVQGPHGCLGLHLARMQTTAVLNGLLDRLPNATLDHDRSVGPSGLIFRKAGTVRVHLPPVP
ncbi:MAG: cytochrome P450 [Actinomycetota bacterium]